MCLYYDKPYRHLIRDNFLSVEECKHISDTWPDYSWEGWVKYGDINTHSISSPCAATSSLSLSSQPGKRASNLLSPLPRPATEAIRKIALLSTELSEAFGVKDLVPDLGLHGGGLHDMERGSHVRTHADATEHPRLGYQRVLSAVIYVHPTWYLRGQSRENRREEEEEEEEEGWGGNLTLLYGDGLPCKEVEPLPGRLVVFDCRRRSLHRVETVTCLEGVSRKSLALWFYSGNREYQTSSQVIGSEEEERHSTAYFLGTDYPGK